MQSSPSLASLLLLATPKNTFMLQVLLLIKIFKPNMPHTVMASVCLSVSDFGLELRGTSFPVPDNKDCIQHLKSVYVPEKIFPAVLIFRGRLFLSVEQDGYVCDLLGVHTLGTN